MKEARPVPEKLGEAECLRLISPGGAGRIAFAGSYDLTVLPVIYQLADGAILFRAAQDGLTEEDLRTGSSTASTGWRSRLTISTRRRGKAGASWSRDLLTISTPRMSRRQPGPRAWSHGRRRAQSLHPRHARPRPPAGGSGRAREPGRGASARASAGEARAVRQGWLRLAEPAGGYPAFVPAMLAGPAGAGAGAGCAMRLRRGLRCGGRRSLPCAGRSGCAGAVLHRPAGARTAGRLHLGRYRAGGRAAGDGL